MTDLRPDIDVLMAKRLAGEESSSDKETLDSLLETHSDEWLKAEKSWLAAKKDWFTEEESKNPVMPVYLRSNTKKIPYGWIAAAASLILIAMISFFLIRENEVEKFAILTQTATEAGEQKELKLSDGTLVKMNAATTLRYPQEFAPDKREIFLEGEAYFEVIPDANRPLIIHGTEANVKVLGTAFNVNAYPGKPMEVAVRSGKVNMVSHSGTGKDVMMVPMMKKGISNKATGTWEMVNSDDQDFDWLEGKLVFKDAPLKDVITEVSRAYGVKISLENQEMATCHISSTFYRNSIEEVLETLSLITGLHYERIGDRYVIRGKGC
ncbi:MAG: DUF4974 domain-containing protein [Bacteroidetes bacterium]|nr:DUF4974 domain-containing protein [Bacteroidota bacterium]